ncbi:MAG: undecaprenyl-diphosphatase UppP [Ignavibacteriae bacterium]|nr:undecaprenyl-diphosphatase UppP [Ignavibacteriota bacterium]MCB9206826.1 undecaprenyl-diphosphatase UppP [Ignavibacteriales bacterium]MCB9210166.1 undecaprenyl-diphosphatase UppP [Ignavibacteriales bacterium]MCB9218449.1 undecaprenyl-diphosphatase UppP [Ignavibacteriales bacterium]MCB9259545.1 undecaprenyl-diphosphatase UppP [Ignavibacteriales bacterium]
MSILEAILLGIIQGLTEFLPISSTGHLTVAGKLMNLISPEHPEHWTSFIAVIQLGTLAAILIYFWNDLLKITIDFFKDNLFARKSFSNQSLNSKMGWYIIIGSIPVVIIGLGFKDVIEGALTKNLYVISGSLIVLGIILAIAEKLGKFKKDIKDIKWYDAIIVGFAQSLALIPGSSRSGTTITAGIFLGFKRETAARFSFLLSVPAILGSGLLQLYEALEFIDSSGMITLIIATVASAISGYLTIGFLLKFLRSNSTFVFVFYRILIGIVIIILIFNNLISA